MFDIEERSITLLNPENPVKDYEEESGLYKFEGETYECDEDVLEILLERKKKELKS